MSNGLSKSKKKVQKPAPNPFKDIFLEIHTPCYGNVLSFKTAQSIFGLQQLAMQYGFGMNIRFMGNESLITRARNRLTYQFLNYINLPEDYHTTHQMTIDADIEFNPNDVLRMLLADKDIIGGAYPAKGINWNTVKKAIELNPEITPKELTLAAGRFVLNFLNPNEIFPNQPTEVENLGTGFLLVKREVFERLVAESPFVEKSFCPYERNEVYKFWRTGPNDAGLELSEDYFFCYMCRKLGMSVYLLPDAILTHTGTYDFQGSIPYLASLE